MSTSDIHGLLNLQDATARQLARYENLAKPITELSKAAFLYNLAKGWYSNPKTGQLQDLEDFNVIAAKLALIHSEVSEALEAVRKDLMDDKLPHRKGIEVELADAVIRILDICGALNLDLGAAMLEKAIYNDYREDHKLEVRALGGKRG